MIIGNKYYEIITFQSRLNVILLDQINGLSRVLYFAIFVSEYEKKIYINPNTQNFNYSNIFQHTNYFYIIIQKYSRFLFFDLQFLNSNQLFIHDLIGFHHHLCLKYNSTCKSLIKEEFVWHLHLKTDFCLTIVRQNEITFPLKLFIKISMSPFMKYIHL